MLDLQKKRKRSQIRNGFNANPSGLYDERKVIQKNLGRTASIKKSSHTRLKTF